jgi:type IV pilus assembly protein PilC
VASTRSKEPRLAKYKYAALDVDGVEVKGVQRATSPGRASAALADLNLQPIRITPKTNILQFEITRKKVPRRDLMHFSRQLAVFIRAGVPLIDGLETINGEVTNKLFKKGLTDIIESLQSGETFSSAATAHPEIFPDVYLGMLKSAEVTGHLDTVLEQLSEYLERDLEARRAITSALLYPVLVLLMSFVTIAILTIYVMPKFRTFFKELNAKLPLPTRMLLAVTGWIQNWWPVILVVLGGALLIGFILNRTEWGRARRDGLLISAPVIGELTRHSILERFCRVLSAMVSAGVPLPEALGITADAANNIIYKRGILTARDEMLRGAGFADPLRRTKLFPAAVTQMFRVGEDTGSLDDQLQTAAVYYERELTYRIKRFTALFEPAVIVFVGVVVGFVAIALVSAMYGIFHQVHP